MSRASFKILNVSEFLNSLRDQFDTDIILNTLQGTLDSSRQRIADVLVDRVFSSPTWRSLFERDVQAELGFLPEELEQVQSELEALLRETVMTQSFVRREGGRFASQRSGNATVFLNISFQALEDNILSIRSAEFVSQNEFNIPWFKWVLDGGSVSGYRVLFEAQARGDGFKVSRTGYAIMAKGGSWSTGPLNFEDDFIAQVLNSEEFAFDIRNVILESYL